MGKKIDDVSTYGQKNKFKLPKQVKTPKKGSRKRDKFGKGGKHGTQGKKELSTTPDNTGLKSLRKDFRPGSNVGLPRGVLLKKKTANIHKKKKKRLA